MSTTVVFLWLRNQRVARFALRGWLNERNGSGIQANTLSSGGTCILQVVIWVTRVNGSDSAFRRVISFIVDFVFKFGSPYIFMPPLHAYPQEPRPSKEQVSYVVLDENTWHTRDT